MTYIIGISAFYHDSAAALLSNGKILAAAEEERFTRKKHDNSFPFSSINYCLAQAGIDINDVKYVTYYEKPLKKFDRITQMFLDTYPFSYIPFWQSFPSLITDKLNVKSIIRNKLKFKGKILFIPHHEAHAASCFLVSPFKKSAILTVDGVGEWQTTGLYLGIGNEIIPLKQINFPNSLGLLYSTFTAFLGFRVNEDEYKIMGLSAYGKPEYKNKIYKLIKVKDDGSFLLDMSHFSFREDFQMWNEKFEKLFGKARLPNDPVLERHKNLAASIQAVTEDIYFKIINYLHSVTKTSNLCMSGGVALNALANGKIYGKTPFKNIYVFGAAGDSGAALGTALFTYYQIVNNKKRNSINSLCLGSSFEKKSIEKALKEKNLTYKQFNNENELLKTIAKLLSENKIIGWCYGKMEFGPRALGARSILANPKPRYMKEEVNKIKIREQFRPFAGSILQEKVHEFFEVPEKNHLSPFMVFCFKVKKEKRKDLAAIVHNDNTCRIQNVSKENDRYYKLIQKFYELTGVPCILNTSFNLKGEPIVETPKQAIEDFLKTKMDYLVINDSLISKVNYKE